MTSHPSRENGGRLSTSAIGLVALVALSLAALYTVTSESRSSGAREVEQHAAGGDDSEGGLSAPQTRDLARIVSDASVPSASEDLLPGGSDNLTYGEQLGIDQFVRDIGNGLGDDPAWYLSHPLLNPDGAAASPELVQQFADLLTRAKEERAQIGHAAGDLAIALVKQRMDDGLENEDLWPDGANQTGSAIVSTSITHHGRTFDYRIHVGDDPGFDALWTQRAESTQNANEELALLALRYFR